MARKILLLGNCIERPGFLGKHEVFAHQADFNHPTGFEPAFQHFIGQNILQMLLNGPFQRPGAEILVVPLLGQPMLGFIVISSVNPC